MIRNAQNERIAGISYIASKKDSMPDNVSSIKVSLERLDDFAESYPDLLGVRFIKCDVEGYELMVFRGSWRVLTQARPIVITEVGNYDRLHSYEERSLFRFFMEMRYIFFAIDANGITLHPLQEPWDRPEGCIQDVLMVPEEMKNIL